MKELYLRILDVESGETVDDSFVANDEFLYEEAAQEIVSELLDRLIATSPKGFFA